MLEFPVLKLHLLQLPALQTLDCVILPSFLTDLFLNHTPNHDITHPQWLGPDPVVQNQLFRSEC